MIKGIMGGDKHVEVKSVVKEITPVDFGVKGVVGTTTTSIDSIDSSHVNSEIKNPKVVVKPNDETLKEKYKRWMSIYEKRRGSHQHEIKAMRQQQRRLRNKNNNKQDSQPTKPNSKPKPLLVFSEIIRKLKDVPSDYRNASVLVQVKRILTTSLSSLERSDCEKVKDMLNGYFDTDIQRAAYRSIIKSINEICLDEISNSKKQTITNMDKSTSTTAIDTIKNQSLNPYIVKELPLVEEETKLENKYLLKSQQEQIKRSERRMIKSQQKGISHHQRHKVNAGREFRQKAEQ